jgi:hypothetical protein
MAAVIPQPFSCYLYPCLEALYREGASYGKADTKHCLACVALHYQIEARKAEPPIDDEGYSLIPMLEFINALSHEKLSGEEIELLAEDVRSTCRTKITCRELKKSETLKNCCVPEDCKLADKSSSASTTQVIPEKLQLLDLTKATGKIERVNPVTGEPEADPDTGETRIAKLTLSPTKASAAILNSMLLRRSATDTKNEPDIWRFEGGIWKPDGEEVIKNLINLVAGDLSYERGRQEIFKRLRGQAQRASFDSDPCILPAQDGVIDLRTGTVSDYRPEDHLTFKYGAEIEGESDILPALWLLCSSLPDPRDVLTALDICAEAVIRRPSDSIIQLIGPGANGKGMYERMISALVTDARITNITLQEAKASRFGPGAVLGKDLWILSEVEEVKQAINLLKYGGRIQGKPHVLPILDCNNAIDFGDDSWGRKRRMIKLDWPFTFDYVPGTRLKDPHLEEKITSPDALAGLLKIIVARAPHLIESKRIYNRKRPEEMAEEYRRQQYSLHYFCEECLTTNEEDALSNPAGWAYPGSTARLLTQGLYDEYLEYCQLFRVPVPAEKGQMGKYLREKFGISSISTREKNEQVRYYPGLWIAKSAKLAHAELHLSFSSFTLASAKLQEKDSENSISSLLASAASGEWPKEVLDEIERMFCFIESCQDPQEICYDKFLQNAEAAEAAEAKGQQVAIPEKSAEAKGHSAVATAEATPEVSTIKAELQLAEDERTSHEEHFKTPVNLKSVYFLQPCPKFSGIDGKDYGPFQKGDLASIPNAHVIGLTKKGIIRLLEAKS